MSAYTPVVITGLGAINGLGHDCTGFWEALVAGHSAVAPVRAFDSTAWRTHLGCEVKEPLPEAGQRDRAFNLVAAAAREALNQARLTKPPLRTGTALGSLLAGINSLEKGLQTQVGRQQDIDVSPFYPDFLMTGLSRFLASWLNLQGPVVTSGIACAASAAAISRAADLIRLGHADVMVAGGAESFNQITFSGFNAIRSAAANRCSPFSKGREGLVIGEGAGILILESLDHARSRGAEPLAVLLGSGLAEDAYHITSPEPEGNGAARAMQAALQDAGLQPKDIDYINAHGTGTSQNDKMETLAIKHVFGEKAKSLPVSSIKAAIGHCMGAAGALEAVASVLTLRHQMAPPTLNFQPGDEDCDLDYVPGHARPLTMKTVLSNSFGFGGNDACLIFGHVDWLREEQA